MKPPVGSFNPLVWLLFRYIREDMELANDAAVLKGMERDAQKEYSLSLVEVLAGCTVRSPKHAMLCMADSKKNIERRIGMIQLGGFFKKRKWMIAVAGVLVIAAVAAVFLTTGANGAIRIDSALEQYMEVVAQEKYASMVYPPGFLITAVKIHGAYQENDVTKVFVTTWATAYQEDGDSVREFSSGIDPAAVTCRKEEDGTYSLIDFKESGMGEAWASSIREYCVLPSGRPIRGLADKIIRYNMGDRNDLDIIRQQKLVAHLSQGELPTDDAGQPLLIPTFLPRGTAALKPLIWGSEGWGIDTQSDYIFAHFWRYVVRYDIKKNQIDKIIDLGKAPESWYYNVTFAPDGQSCVAQAHEFDGPGQTGRVLIDLKNETYVSTKQEHFPALLGSLYQIEYQYGMGWFINGAEIKVLRPYAEQSGTAVAIAMDENRVGAILPSDAGWDALGYYKFAVIDLNQDKIVQECPMNVLKPGETLSLYPTEPTTLAPVMLEQVSNDLFDFALLERLFSMSYADLCREEGKTVELHISGGGYGCRFSKYGDVGFGFGGDGDSPLVMLGFKPSDNLMHKQSLTFGELRQWLDKNKVVYTIDPTMGPECYFVIGDYTFNTGIESEQDSAAIIYFEVICGKNKTSG